MSFTRFKYEPITILLVVNVILREGDAQIQASLSDEPFKFILIINIRSCACSKEEPGRTGLRLLGTF